jgi:hypothetical protein
MRVGAVHRLGLLTVALAIAPGVALAQDSTPNSIPNAALESYASASPPSNPTDEPAAAPDRPLSPEESAALDAMLQWTPPDSAAPAKPIRLPSFAAPKSFDISHTGKSDGSGTVVLKQSVYSDWDANVGADLGLSPARSLYDQPDQSTLAAADRGTGAAWASVGVVPNLATVDARVDPSNDQGKVGTTFKRAVPLGSKFSVTLQNSSSVTETFSASSAATSDLPLMAVPAVSSTVATPHVWGNETAAKFNILPTGTAFGAQFAANSADPYSHNTLSADQKLYGPLHVTTAVTDLGQTTSSRSITAGFKVNW